MKLPARFWPFMLLVSVVCAAVGAPVGALVYRMMMADWPRAGPYAICAVLSGLITATLLWLARHTRQDAS
jgi:hypothetical protein